MTVENIAIIGAGTMGNGIGHVFAQHGHGVVLVDSDPVALGHGLETIGRNFDRQIKKEKATAEDKAAALESRPMSSERSTRSLSPTPSWPATLLRSRSPNLQPLRRGPIR